MSKKIKEECTNCEATYSITWKLDDANDPPTFCPFCGEDTEIYDDDEDFDINDEDDWE